MKSFSASQASGAAALILFSGLFGGCHSSQPADAPVRYFSAIEKRNCAALKLASGGKLARELAQFGCEDAFQKMQKHNVKFLNAANPRPDGRDPAARLLTLRLLFDGAPRTFVVRVEKSGSDWTLATL